LAAQSQFLVIRRESIIAEKVQTTNFRKPSGVISRDTVHPQWATLTIPDNSDSTMHRSHHPPALLQVPATPTPKIGIVGGGQLARMTAMAAGQFGCEVVVLERQDDFPAHSLDTHALIGDWNDPEWLLKLASQVDVVTLENEFVNGDALAALREHGHALLPSAETIMLVQDKLQQKRTFLAAGLPLPQFADAPTPESIASFGFPAVLKTRRNGYDGKGNATIESAGDVPAAWARLNGGGQGLYVEEWCPSVKELALIVTRKLDGDVVSYPVVETINREHICHLVHAPASIPLETASAATELAVRAVTAVGGVGSFGIELFMLADGRLLINEIAPRVHNTGHYTIEGCVTSQFENHIRALLGLPLGSTRMVAPAACMVNLLGYADGSGVPVGLSQALKVPGAHIHIYGKKQTRRGRKMGHITVLAGTIDEAHDLAQQAADCIHFGG
jgi:5-(carboxyamino)imidazole ribonucleotide synthase